MADLTIQPSLILIHNINNNILILPALDYLLKCMCCPLSITLTQNLYSGPSVKGHSLERSRHYIKRPQFFGIKYCECM